MSAVPEGEQNQVPRPRGQHFVSASRAASSAWERNEGLLGSLLPIICSLGMLAWLLTADRDGRIASHFFDVDTGQWPWVGHWLTKSVLHDGGTKLIGSTAAAFLLFAIFGGSRPSMKSWRLPALYMFLCIGISGGLVALLKSVCPDPTPWNSLRFGGHIKHGLLPFMSKPVGVALGKGSPGAFASGWFALMGSYYIWRDRNLRVAWTCLLLGWLLGNLAGAVQVMRGAHFPSHNYLSASVAWLVCSSLYWGPFRARMSRPGMRGGP